MLDFYLSRMVQRMIDANEGVGADSDFGGKVLNGFPIATLNAAGISQANVWRNVFNLNFIYFQDEFEQVCN